MRDVLPDSRSKAGRNAVIVRGVCYVPVFCANCGKDGGLCPEESTTFLFYLCDGCAESHGPIAGTMLVPDEVFWKRIEEEQMEKFGRLLSSPELAAVVESDASPLATLLLRG